MRSTTCSPHRHVTFCKRRAIVADARPAFLGQGATQRDGSLISMFPPLRAQGHAHGRGRRGKKREHRTAESFVGVGDHRRWGGASLWRDRHKEATAGRLRRARSTHMSELGSAPKTRTSESSVGVVVSGRLAASVCELSLSSLRCWPENPRTIRPERLEDLKRALVVDREMLSARPLIALPDGTVICGTSGCLQPSGLGWATVPVVTVDLDEKRARLWASGTTTVRRVGRTGASGAARRARRSGGSSWR